MYNKHLKIYLGLVWLLCSLRENVAFKLSLVSKSDTVILL